MKNKKRLLVTGVSGLLGSNLAYCLRDDFEIAGLYHSKRIDLQGISPRWSDLRNLSQTRALINDFDPHLVVHCAAEADVDTCETQPERAVASNVLTTANLVAGLENSKAKLVHISTDLVYDGTKGAYSEIDPVKPVNYYGLTKLDSEYEALKRPGTLVLRTNFFGWGIPPRRSLAQWLIEEIKENKPLQGFNDVYFTSLYTFDLASLIARAVDKGLTGIYNCGSSTSLSKYEFLVHLAKAAGFNAQLIRPVSVDQFPFKAKRAKNLSMNVTKLAHDLGVAIPSIEQSIEHFIRDLDKRFPDAMLDGNAGKVYFPDLDYIPYGRQAIDDSDIRAVEEVIVSPNLTKGPKVEQFEKQLSQFTGAAYAAAVNSGTSALHLACLAAGVGPGDEVITTANTFVASANCAAYVGARPVIVDIDDRTYNISPEQIERRISAKTKAVIPVHFAGQSADMELIRQVIDRAQKKFGKKIFIIEDATHALGSLYKGEKVGSGKYSDMTVLSFHPVKHITTGEGGAVLTNDKNTHLRLSSLRSHGTTMDISELKQSEEAFEPGGAGQEKVRRKWYYEQQWLGFNYRITDLQCALGLSQLKKLPEFIKRRSEIRRCYHEAFKNISVLTVPYESEQTVSNFHLYVLLFDFPAIGKSRHQVMTELEHLGIHTQVHYIPVHTQPYFQKTFGTTWGDCPKAEAYYRRCLSIPFFPAMTDDDVAKVVRSLKKVIGA